MTNYLAYHHELAARLNDAGDSLQSAADRVPQRQRHARRAMDAAQAKTAAELVSRGWISTESAEAVLDAAESLVTSYEAMDMEAVHRERAARRDALVSEGCYYGFEGCNEPGPHEDHNVRVVYL
jgi:hypothetical protein